ncbi:MAG: methyltransferase domain-containing protein [Acidimicrobiia bacterium]
MRSSATSATDAAGVRAAYAAAGAHWQAGPGIVYDRLARELVACSPRTLAGARVADVGAGTGAAGRAARAAGAGDVVSIDLAAGILVGADLPGPALVADAGALPLADRTVDAAIAAFSFNHLADPVTGFAEAHRVVRAGGVVVAGTYATDDDHPVKAAVAATLAAHGWEAPGWYRALRDAWGPALGTPEGCRAAAGAAGLDGRVLLRRVRFADLGPRRLVEWRFGMAQHAPFLARLDPVQREELARAAVLRLGDAPPLVRSVLVTVAVVG